MAECPRFTESRWRIRRYFCADGVGASSAGLGNRGIYVSPDEQEKYDPALSDAIGWYCIQRRNLGLPWAHDMGASVVAVVDDDNIPRLGWGENLLFGCEVDVNFYETDLPAFDPVGATNHKHIWHRGFPLQLLPKRDYSRKSRKKIIPDMQADFWDGDPDKGTADFANLRVGLLFWWPVSIG